MNRELAEVRRYWPKAKQSKSGARFWAAGKRVNLTLVAEVWEVDFASDAPLPALIYIGQTIPEVMRAAGFGRRQLGEYASRLKSARTVLYRRGTYVAISTIDWPPMCVDRQRPRKGARLGRRKRELQP